MTTLPLQDDIAPMYREGTPSEQDWDTFNAKLWPMIYEAIKTQDLTQAAKITLTLQTISQIEAHAAERFTGIKAAQQQAIRLGHVDAMTALLCLQLEEATP